MRQFVLALSLLISVLIPTASHAEWVKVGKNYTLPIVEEATIYIDTKVRKDDGHIYFWQLVNALKPNENGDLSTKSYHEADCGKFRRRVLQFSYHPQPMGRGPSSISQSVPIDDYPGWDYPAPGSGPAAVLEAACKMAKNQ